LFRSSLTSSVAEQIIAFVPVYTETGESTALWLQDGRVLIDPRGIRTCLQAFWRHYSFDWVSYRCEYAPLLNRKNLLPWPADVRRTFAPAKLRSPQIGRDPAYGYFVVEQVQSVQATDAGQAAATMVHFRNGSQLPVYLSTEEVHRSLQAAAYAAQQFWRRRLGPSRAESDWMGIDSSLRAE